ncbi:MAG TPA: hypothetical protein VI320_35985, partial [Terracidiphilus sp.]
PATTAFGNLRHDHLAGGVPASGIAATLGEESHHAAGCVLTSFENRAQVSPMTKIMQLFDIKETDASV